MRLLTARQKKNEAPQHFADRCRALSQKIMCKTSEPVAQRNHRENAERMLLAIFVAGFAGTPGKQVRYAGPRDIDQAVSIAIGVQEPKNQSGLMKDSIRNLLIRLDCQRGHPVGPARITLSLSDQLIAQWSITCVVNATNLRTALTSQQHQLPGMHRRKLKSGVMSAKG